MSKEGKDAKRRAHVRGKRGNGAKQKYDKRPHDCEHTGRLFDIEGKVEPIINQTPDGEVVIMGHALVVYRVQCKECGTYFRFKGLAKEGDPREVPMMLRGGFAMQTPVVPDLLVIKPPAKKLVLLS